MSEGAVLVERDLSSLLDVNKCVNMGCYVGYFVMSNHKSNGGVPSQGVLWVSRWSVLELSKITSNPEDESFEFLMHYKMDRC